MVHPNASMHARRVHQLNMTQHRKQWQGSFGGVEYSSWSFFVFFLFFGVVGLKMGQRNAFRCHQRQARKKCTILNYFRTNAKWIFGTEVHLLVNSFISAREATETGRGFVYARFYFCFHFFFFGWWGKSFSFLVTPWQRACSWHFWEVGVAFFCSFLLSKVGWSEIDWKPHGLRDMQFVLVSVTRRRHTNCNNKIICRSSWRWLSHTVGGAVHQLLLRRAGVSWILCRHGDKVSGWVILKLKKIYIYKLICTICSTGWHYCDIDGRQATFLCPNGTQFSQAVFVCDWWFNVRCDLSPRLYAINARLYQRPKVNPTRPHRIITKQLVEDIFTWAPSDLPINKCILSLPIS